MEKNEAEALISVRTYSGSGLAELKVILSQMAPMGKISKVSSVYKIKSGVETRMRFGQRSTPQDAEGLILVFSLATELAAKDVLHAALKIETEHQKSKQYKTLGVNLLAFNQEILTMPTMTLPHPELHLRLEELVPAAEIWPNYKHPVLQKTFRELALESSSREWGEFYSQGPALLDFSPTD